MRNRCKYPSTYAWKWYGAKGIRVCERWDSDYGNFLADMGEAPEGMSIDRIDRHGHYEPGNCKWSDQKTQMNNTARNIIVEYDGQKMSVTQLCDLTELPYRPVHWLIKRRGMSAAEAVETIRARQPQNLTGLQRRQSV